MEQEKEIIQNILAGNTGGYRTILCHYGAKIHGFIARMVWSEPDVEELTQNAFLKAFRHLSSYNQDKASFSVWLHQIAYNEALMFLRRRKPAVIPIDDNLNWLNISDNEADRMLNNTTESRVELLEKAIGILPPEDQTLLQLHYTEGMKLKEISFIVGKDAAYLATKLQRIRKKLCVIIERMEDDEKYEAAR